jgi:hypothetical protein
MGESGSSAARGHNRTLAMTIKFAEQKIKEARQRVAALDRELADLRRQSRKVAKSLDTRVALLAMRDETAHLEEQRCQAYWALAELIELAEMPPAYMGWA